MSRAESSTQFLYTAVGPDGGRKRGLRVAKDEPSLSDALREEGLLLLSARRMPAWTAGAAILPMKDQSAFNLQLATMLDRGVPLVEALEVAGSVVSKRARERVERLRSLVRAGSSFADACAQVGGFDDISIAVYRAAERTGNLGDACRRLATAAQRLQAITTKATTLMIYPAILLTVSVVVSAVVLTVVVPRIGDAIRDAGQALPWYTEAVISLGETLRTWGVLILVGVVGLLVLLFIARRIVLAGLGAALRRLRPVARLSLAMESARFFAVMGAMTRSGVTIADALGVATGAVNHPALRSQLDDLRRRLVEGGLMRALLEQVDALPLATRRLLIAAERAGDLDSAFDSLATDMALEVDKRSERLLALLEPALIFFMFLLIGSLIVSILIPLLSLTSGGD